MADNEGLADGSFSQLLFADEVVGLDIDGCFNYASTFSTAHSPKYLYFVDYRSQNDLGFSHKSGVTYSDSSSTSSTNNANINFLSMSKKKRNGYVNEGLQNFSTGIGAPMGS